MSGQPEVELVFNEALTSLTVLAFCRTVRDSLAIEVESKPGQGTTRRVTGPVS